MRNADADTQAVRISDIKLSGPDRARVAWGDIYTLAFAVRQGWRGGHAVSTAAMPTQAGFPARGR